MLYEVITDPQYYELKVTDKRIRTELFNRASIAKLLVVKNETSFLLSAYNRGEIKLQLIKIGYPVDDQVQLQRGPNLPFSFRELTLGGKEFAVRNYQKQASDALLGDLGPGTGFGTIVLRNNFV